MFKPEIASREDGKLYLLSKQETMHVVWGSWDRELKTLVCVCVCVCVCVVGERSWGR